jgi:hypothetical protein
VHQEKSGNPAPDELLNSDSSKKCRGINFMNLGFRPKKLLGQILIIKD